MTDDVPLGRRDVVVQGVLSPGAFRYQGRIGLLLRVAERPGRMRYRRAR